MSRNFQTPADIDELQSFVLDARGFSKRMGNYLYLPVFLVCGFCSLVMLASHIALQERGASEFFTFSVVISFVLWRLSSTPRARLFLVEGILLGWLTFVWVGWYIFNLAVHLSQFWPTCCMCLIFSLCPLEWGQHRSNVFVCGIAFDPSTISSYRTSLKIL